MPTLPLTAVFTDLPDPRRETGNKLHRLTDILTITTCAVIGGAESWEAVAEYGRTKAAFFRRFLKLDNGIPSPDTFARVFAKLAPGAFAQAFGRWMAAACEAYFVGMDGSRIREGNAGADLAIVRRVAVSLLRRAPGKGSGVTKRLKAGWDDDYMLQVLQGITAPIVR